MLAGKCVQPEIINFCKDRIGGYNSARIWGYDNDDINNIRVNSELVNYREKSEAILLYYIFDNYVAWKKIFVNALISMEKRLVICFKTEGRSAEDIKDMEFLIKIFDCVFESEVIDDTTIFTITKVDVSDTATDNKYNGRIAVCTCILGKYDNLRAIGNKPENVDFICFTDNPEMAKDKGWDIDLTPYHYDDKWVQIDGRISISDTIEQRNHPNICAKYYKMCLSRIPRLQHYNKILYIDASLEIKDASFLIDYDKDDKDFIMWKHMERNNIREEASGCKRYARYYHQPTIEQADSYYAEGFDLEYLVAAGFHFRKNTDILNRMCLYWFYEVQKWTDLCQISAPYVHWLFGCVPHINQESVFWNKWLHFHHHVYNY